MSELVSKEYLSKQFTGYSVVLKEQLNKKIDIQQDVADANKLLGIGVDGVVTPIEAPSSVKVSAESDNQIEEKQDGIYVKDMSAKISAETDNAIEIKDDGLYVPTVSETKVSADANNIISSKDDGLFAEETITEIQLNNTPLTVTDKKVNIDLSDYENVQSDWEETDETSDAFIKNKPTIPSTDGLATETFVTDKIAEAQLGGEEVDLTEYIKEADADEKYVLDEEIETITAEQIEELIGLSADEITNLASLLSDQTIELSKTWSSSCIYGKLNETLDSAKAYTLQELAKSIGASYKVVTSVDQMTDSKVLYLLKDADSGMYNIYVYDADTSTAELIGSFEINLDDYLKISDAEAQYVKQTDLVANYATKQEVVDGYATKTELQDAIADVEVEISTDENNQLENRENGLFVDSETVTISKADYDALSIEEKSNGKTYFVPDDETTEDGTDLTQFAKVSDLEETNNKIEEINTDLGKKLSLSGGEMSGGIEMKGNTIGSVGDIFLNDKGAFLNALLTNINNNLAQLIKTTMVTASADISANSSVFMRVSPPETPSGYRDLFAFIQGGSGSIDTSQLLVGSGTTGCRVYNNLSQKQTVTIECRIVYIKNC